MADEGPSFMENLARIVGMGLSAGGAGIIGLPLQALAGMPQQRRDIRAQTEDVDLFASQFPDNAMIPIMRRYAQRGTLPENLIPKLIETGQKARVTQEAVGAMPGLLGAPPPKDEVASPPLAVDIRPGAFAGGEMQSIAGAPEQRVSVPQPLTQDIVMERLKALPPDVRVEAAGLLPKLPAQEGQSQGDKLRALVRQFTGQGYDINRAIQMAKDSLAGVEPKESKDTTPISRVENKVEQGGVASLTPGEREVWEAHHKPEKARAPHFEKVTDAQGLQHLFAIREQPDGEFARQEVGPPIPGHVKLENFTPGQLLGMAKGIIQGPISADQAGLLYRSMKAEEEAKEQRLIERGVTIAQRRAEISDQFRQAAEARRDQRSEMKNVDKRTAVLGDLDQMLRLAKEIDNAGLLPGPNSTGLGMAVADLKRRWYDPSNQALIAFRGLFGPIMIGEVDRGVFDEKGVRAVQMFKAQFDMIDRMPSYAATERFVNEMKASIQRKQQTGGAPDLPAPPPGFSPVPKR